VTGIDGSTLDVPDEFVYVIGRLVWEGAGGWRGGAARSFALRSFLRIPKCCLPEAAVSDSTTRPSEPLNKGITLITPEISIG